MLSINVAWDHEADTAARRTTKIYFTTTPEYKVSLL